MHKIVTAEDLDALAEEWQRTAIVYAPVRDEHGPAFRQLNGAQGAELHLGANTRYPPKSLYLAQSEPMFRVHESSFEPFDRLGAPRVALGVRPCDARASQLLDEVFAAPDNPDPFWVQKREQTAVVALGCAKPGPTCFCSTVGSGPFDARGVDVLLTGIGGAYVAEVTSDKGAALFARAPAATEAQIEAARAVQAAAQAGMDAAFETDGIRDVLYDLFETGFWAAVQQSCLGCGVCTYLCPTCHCFDIVDEVQRRERVRNWDTCMFRIYSQEASGHNPRPTNVERTRQRIMHKYAYFLDNQGEIGCTGCGRCVRYCPVGLDIREIIRHARAWEPA